MACRLNPESILITSCGCHIYLKGMKIKGTYQLVSSSSVKIKGKMLYAHRVSYEDNFGEIPEGKLVLHRCDIGCCVNPDHLYIGDYKQNALDRSVRGRNAPVTDSFKFSMRGKKISDEKRAKISGENNHFFGKKHSEETKEKIRNAMNNISDETRAKMREAQKARRCRERSDRN